MRIALVTTDLSGRGGWSRYSADIGKALAQKGHVITAIVHEKSGVDWAEEIPVLGREVDMLGSKVLRLMNAWKLWRALRRAKPDIVHFMAEPYGLLLPFVHGPWKTCLTIHGTYAVLPLAKGPSLRRLATKMYREVDHVFSVSIFTRTHLKEFDPSAWREAGLEEKTTVCKNGIDLARVPPLKEARRENERKVIVGVGALKERKGYLQAVEACAHFLKTFHIDFQYDIFGSLEQDPLYVAQLMERISELGLEDRVTLHGSVAHDILEHAYQHADLFLLLSQSSATNIEGFGLVFLEASARGVPVIGPRSGGCPEAIRENRSGYTVDATNAKLVSERMHQVLVQKSIRREQCRFWAEENSIEKRVGELEREYETMTKKF